MKPPEARLSLKETVSLDCPGGPMLLAQPESLSFPGSLQPDSAFQEDNLDQQSELLCPDKLEHP